MKCISDQIAELETRVVGSKRDDHSFKGFDDPWKVMSPEDHKEANRLQILALKTFPSSPKQKAIKQKLNAILKKYSLPFSPN